MEKDIENKRYYVFLVTTAFLFYLISICIKMVYSAELVSIITYFNTSKSDAGLGLTFYYIVYAVAQLVLAAKKKGGNELSFMVITTVISAMTFVGIIFVTSIWQVWIILAVNGILQSSIWGGLIHYLDKYLPPSWAHTVSIVMSLGFALGTALSYGACAFFVAFFNWKASFVFFAILLAAALFLFCAAERAVKKRVPKERLMKTAQSTEQPLECGKEKAKKSNAALLTYILILSFFICCLYYGITNWVPNLLKEVHNVDESYSMLITILMPLGMVFGPMAADAFIKKNMSIYEVSALFIGIAAVCMLLMAFFYDLHIVFAIIISLIALFFNRGIVNLIVGYMPFMLRDVIDAKKSAMLINAAACMGAAVMPYLTGLIMDYTNELGWVCYYAAMFITAIVSILLLALGILKQRKSEKNT